MPKCLSSDLEGAKGGPKPIPDIRLDSERFDPTFSDSVEKIDPKTRIQDRFASYFFDAVEKYAIVASLGGSIKTP